MQGSASELLDLLNSIQKRKPVTVSWLDASTTTNAKIGRFPLENYYVETRRRTTGAFLCLQKGYARKAWHIVLEMDHTDALGSSIRSIPLCLVYEVVADVQQKSAESAEKKRIKLRDGSMKQIEALETSIPLRSSAVKYVD